MEIGFIGLGAMGRAMATNLVAAGHSVVAWNRSNATVDGLKRADAPAEAFSSDVVFTMLSDDAAIKQVLLDGDGRLDAHVVSKARSGVVHVVCSTISIAFAAHLAKAHTDAGISYVAAPVLGRPDAAARGELNILAAGSNQAIERVHPLLEILGSRVWVLGDQPQRANAAKIACNMMIAMAIEAMAESAVLVEANGLSRERFFELILGTLFGGRAYQIYSKNIADKNFEPGFKAQLGLKDLGLAKEAAAAAHKTLPMLDAVHGRMSETVGAGMAHRDWSAMADFTINHSR